MHSHLPSSSQADVQVFCARKGYAATNIAHLKSQKAMFRSRRALDPRSQRIWP
jgi:hypothetical protein